MIKKKIISAVSALSVLSLGVSAQAAENIQSFALDEIVVVADRINANGDTVKTSVNVKELIDAGQIKTAADILANVPGIVIKKGQNNGIQVGLRGLNHERTVIAINGNVVQNIGEIAMGRALEWDALPVTGVKKIELIRGGGSAIYGGAVGGVINIITDDADVQGSKTTLRQSFGSWNTFKTTVSNQGSLANQKLSWNFNASKSKGDGYYRNNDFNAHDIHFDTTYKINDNDKLNLSYSHLYKKEGIILGNNKEKNPASGYLGYDSSYPTTPTAPMLWIDGYRQWKTDNVALSYSTPSATVGVYDYRQSRNDYVNRLIMKKGKPSLSGMNKYWDSDIRDHGMNWRQTSHVGAHTLLYGLQYSKMEYDIHRDNYHYDLPSVGVFLEDNWRLTDKTTLGLGLRYDHTKFKADSGALREKTNTQFSPKVKLSHNLNDNNTLYASANRIFRSPTVADYSRWSTGYTDKDGSYQAAFAPGLTHDQWQELLGVPDPEKGMNYEVGWRSRLGDKTSVGLTGFYYDIKDFLNIAFRGGLRPPIVYNIDKVKVHGIELTAEHRLNDHWAMTAGYTRQKTKKSGDRFSASLKGMPESTFNSGVRWDSLHGLQAAFDLRYLGKTPYSSDNDYISPYTVADLTVSYAFGRSIINLAVNNIFDRYYEESSGYRQPGINCNISYQYTF